MLLECVPNVSEGREPVVLGALAQACGPALLDEHADPDHNRAVFTLAGTPELLVDAARGLAAAALAHIDLRDHSGVHPRLGALDVVPFVALDPRDAPAAGELAREFAGWLGSELGIPTFLYGGARAPGSSRRSLPEIRNAAFTDQTPDFGPPTPHPTAGATAVGERPILIAVNCDLACDDLAVAQSIAAEIRERDGGLPGVRALGFDLRSRRRSQVSMNLVDLAQTGIEVAYSAVRDRARAYGTDVAGVEVVGLLPAAELERCSAEFIEWSGISAAKTIEARLAAREAAL